MIDLDFGGPTFNAVVKSTQAGDFLGMGAVAERLYGRVFPGLNNNVRHIRVYAAICWVVDYAVSLETSGEKKKFLVSELAKTTTALLDKIQLLLTWQAREDGEKMVPGTSAFAGDRTKSDLTFEGWDVQTTFMSALYYGPGLVNGLGLIGRGSNKRDKGTFTPKPAGKVLARAFEKELQNLAPAALRWLTSPNEITCDKRRLSTLSGVISLGRPSKGEQLKFLQLYLDGTLNNVPIDLNERQRLFNAKKRRQSVVLALRSLKAIELAQGKSASFASVDEIRQVMAAGCSSRTFRVALDGVEESWREWFVLQVRQLQRLAMEVLLGLVERTILQKEQAKEPSFKSDVCAELTRLICETDSNEIKLSTTLAEAIAWYGHAQAGYATLQAAGVCESENKEFLNIGAMKKYLRGYPIAMQPNDVEGTIAAWALTGKFASNALIYCAFEIRNLRALVQDDKRAKAHVEELISFDSDKLSLGELSAVVDKFKHAPLTEFIAEMIERHVIDQHLRTATSRSAIAKDGKNRFIFTQESHGLSRWREGRANKFVYAQEAHDILLNALLLLEDCGCLAVNFGIGPQGGYYRSAEFKLKPAGRKLLADNSVEL